MNPAAVAPSSRVDQLHARLQVARARSEDLFQIVRPAALYDRPVPERHRIIFYLGHLEAFDWNLLAEPLGLSPFDPDFDKLFAFGIDLQFLGDDARLHGSVIGMLDVLENELFEIGVPQVCCFLGKNETIGLRQ